MEIIIDKAKRNDAEIIFSLETDLFPESRTLSDIENYVYSPISIFNVARLGAEIVGYIIVFGDDIISIATKESYRRAGIGGELLKSVFATKTELFLEVRESNSRAISFYKKYGFKSVGNRNKYYPDGENAIIMSYTE